jgi:prepilin-type N-terminal cleavage/methylation domain-containing protein
MTKTLRNDAALRRGFTLIELLVVIAIIGILIALLLPAVQSARAAARRLECSNNLKNISLALHNYHTASNRLPFACAYNEVGGTWVAMVLPYIEQQNHYNLFDFKLRLNHAKNKTAVTTPVKLFACPADPAGLKPVMKQRCQTCPDCPEEQMALWYPASMGPTQPDSCAFCAGGHGTFCCQGSNYGSQNASFVGMFGRFAKSVRFSEVRDGLSNTFMIGESLPTECFHNQAFGSNFPIAGTQIPLGIRAKPSEMPQPGMDQTTLHSTNPHWKLCGFKSMHGGGAFFAMADGSVHFVNDSIDYKLYNELGTRSGYEPVSLVK